MIIIIDAYNLLRSVPPYKKTITDKERSQFIKNLSAYGRRKEHKMVIVFDGGPHEWPFRENMKIVTIVYSGIHETADDFIKEYMHVHRAKDLLLVTSDAELNRCAQQLQISSIDSLSFSQLVREGLRVQEVAGHKNGDIVVKLAHDNDNSSDIDELMMQASKSVSIKSEDLAPVDNKNREAKKSQHSKNERALLKKLNKL